MSKDMQGQERTEPATPKRREKAREEGQVARSVEIASVAVLATGLAGLAAYGGRMTELAARLLTGTLGGLGASHIDMATIVPLASDVARYTAAIILPFVSLVGAAGLGAHLLQVGVLITSKPLQPKMNRISPATGLKRIFSKRGAVELVKSLMKLFIVGAVVGWTVFTAADELFPLMTTGLLAGYGHILFAMFKTAGAGAFALALLAILDFFFQRYDFEQQIRMTRQEVKEEMKQSEGDPKVKSRVRALQQEISRRRMMQDVRTADVVVTNPVRFAVALKYDATRMKAPRVVAKGARLMARRIREIARQAGIPIVEDPPLARALYDGCRIGGEVPLTLYKAVAELLAFVFRGREAGAAGGAR